MPKQNRVVFIHGVGLDQTMWTGVTDCLGDTFQCHAIDMPGHGNAAAPSTPGLAGYTQGVLASLSSDHIDEEGFALVGFSMGAMIAAKIALDLPAAVSRLVLMNAVYDRGLEQQKAINQRLASAEQDGPRALVDAAISRWFTESYVASNPDIIASVRSRLENNNPASFLAAYRVFAMADAELAPLIPNVACPTLAMTAEHDANSTPAMSMALAKVIPGAEAYVLEGLAHGAPIEAPERVALVIKEFLSNGGAQ